MVLEQSLLDGEPSTLQQLIGLAVKFSYQEVGVVTNQSVQPTFFLCLETHEPGFAAGWDV